MASHLLFSEVLAAVLTVTLLALLFTVLRMIARRIRRVPIGLDDWLILLSLILLFVLSGICIGMAHWGMGRDSRELPAGNSRMVHKLLYVFEICYVIDLATIKISILIMYRRIFVDFSKYFRVGSLICGTIVVLWALAFVPAAIFQCTPVSRAWDIDEPGSCINLHVGFYCVALPNILTDIAILTLPIQICWHLHTRLLYRISICAIFMLGAFVIGVSIYRFTTLFGYSAHNVAGTVGPATLWSVIECAVAIICACLPLLVPVVRKVSSLLGCCHVSDSSPNRLRGEYGNNPRIANHQNDKRGRRNKALFSSHWMSELSGSEPQTFEHHELSRIGLPSPTQDNEAQS